MVSELVTKQCASKDSRPQGRWIPHRLETRTSWTPKGGELWETWAFINGIKAVDPTSVRECNELGPQGRGIVRDLSCYRWYQSRGSHISYRVEWVGPPKKVNCERLELFINGIKAVDPTSVREWNELGPQGRGIVRDLSCYRWY